MNKKEIIDYLGTYLSDCVNYEFVPAFATPIGGQLEHIRLWRDDLTLCPLKHEHHE